MITAINKLEYLADQMGADISTSSPDDKYYYDVTIQLNDIEYYLIVLLHDDKYYISDLGCNKFAHLVYPEVITNGYTPEQRDDEIMSNLRKLIKKELKFNKKPNLLNKHRGFIILDVDGKSKKIFMKGNELGLSV
jgi:hypothetical protein